MIRKGLARLVAAAATIAMPGIALAEDAAPRPAALVADQIPAVPLAMVERTRPYMEHRTASFVDWDPKTKAMLVSTRFGDTSQLHRVASPTGQREQLTFASEPVYSARYAPDGSALLFQTAKAATVSAPGRAAASWSPSARTSAPGCTTTST